MATRRKRKVSPKAKPISRKDLNKKFFGLAREIKNVSATGVTRNEIKQFVHHLLSNEKQSDE
jgi:hypothetical protein